MFNLFRLLESETMEMFSMRARNKSKYTFVATKVCETVEDKRMIKPSNPKKSDCNGTRTHYHLVRKRTLNYLAKLAK